MSKTRIALAGLAVSGLLMGAVMEPAMAAKAKVKVQSHKTIKQTSGRGGNAESGDGGAGGAGASGGAVASNNPGSPVTVTCFTIGGTPPGAVTCVVAGGPASTGGVGGAGGAGGLAVGGNGGANFNSGDNADANLNSGNATSAG